MNSELEYLLAGDPAIRWQTMRDLLDASPGEWIGEREKVGYEGWGARFLATRESDGTWPPNRWKGGTWTLVILADLGLQQDAADLRPAFERVVHGLIPKGQPVSQELLLTDMDLCHMGFWLTAGAQFLPDDERLKPLAETLLSQQFPDGGWNCRSRTVKGVSHSSFHTTFNVLEGLRRAADAGIIAPSRFDAVEARAMEFMLEHRMYRSDKTGEIIHERFLDLTNPPYWHYNVLRGLDYMRLTPAITDPRLNDALDYIESRRKPTGRWPVEKRIPGDVHFDMEKMGQDSRWNTLRALRVLKSARRG